MTLNATSTIKTHLSIIAALTSISLLTGTILASNTVSADDAEVIDQVRLTVPVACTMSGTGTTHTATLNPGTYSGESGSEYENGIGKTTLTAICNDDNGFSIYAIGYTGNEYGATNLIGENTAGTIATKAYTSGDTTSNWSMKLTKITDSAESYNPANLTITTGYDDYHAVPSTYTKVAQYKANTGSSTTDTTLGVKLETTYAAFIASNQPADTYVGQIKYTMVHPYDEQPLLPVACQSGKICYNANGSNVEGTMGQPTISTSATSATLLAANFSRQGYGFAGWSNKYDYATNPNQEGIEFYGPQEDITFTAGQYTGTNPGLSLYAVWVKSEGSIQDATKVSQICNRLTQSGPNVTKTLNSVSALTDERDNETYAIAKLADGNCWMIENLRLESTAAHNSDGSLAQGYGTNLTYGDFSGLADAEGLSMFANTSTANSLYSTNGNDGTIKIGSTNAAYRFPRYNNANTPTDASNRPNSPSNNNNKMYSYGNYYTWNAAIADTTNHTSANLSATTTSICPLGWRLPMGGNKDNETNNEFWTLTVTGLNNGITPTNYETNTYYKSISEARPIDRKLRSYPNNFIYAGYYGAGSSHTGNYGHYWSSTISNSDTAYFLDFNTSDNEVWPGTHNAPKYYGKTIRCIATQ